MIKNKFVKQNNSFCIQNEPGPDISELAGYAQPPIPAVVQARITGVRLEFPVITRVPGGLLKMRDATLCFLVRGNPAREVLLGFKKTGFGAGKYNGFGGKVELGERIPQAAIRELAEECGIVVAETALRHRADLSFSFPYRPDWNQRVFVFVAVTWSGIAVESREMRPEWFAVDQIPYHQMWQDDRYWLPRVLAKRPLAAHFVFAEDNETIAEMTLHDLATS